MRLFLAEECKRRTLEISPGAVLQRPTLEQFGQRPGSSIPLDITEESLGKALDKACAMDIDFTMLGKLSTDDSRVLGIISELEDTCAKVATVLEAKAMEVLPWNIDPAKRPLSVGTPIYAVYGVHTDQRLMSSNTKQISSGISSKLRVFVAKMSIAFDVMCLISEHSMPHEDPRQDAWVDKCLEFGNRLINLVYLMLETGTSVMGPNGEFCFSMVIPWLPSYVALYMSFFRWKYATESGRGEGDGSEERPEDIQWMFTRTPTEVDQQAFTKAMILLRAFYSVLRVAVRKNNSRASAPMTETDKEINENLRSEVKAIRAVDNNWDSMIRFASFVAESPDHVGHGCRAACLGYIAFFVHFLLENGMHDRASRVCLKLAPLGRYVSSVLLGELLSDGIRMEGYVKHTYYGMLHTIISAYVPFGATRSTQRWMASEKPVDAGWFKAVTTVLIPALADRLRRLDMPFADHGRDLKSSPTRMLSLLIVEMASNELYFGAVWDTGILSELDTMPNTEHGPLVQARLKFIKDNCFLEKHLRERSKHSK